jgi:ubiquinol oxidase
MPTSDPKSDMPSPAPVSAAIGERPPFGAMQRLDADRLRQEQVASMGSARREYSRSARVLFAGMDLLYGRERTLAKFRVLELVARVPYQAWENVAYVAVTHTARQPHFARRIFDKVRVSRFEQDNVHWHVLVLEELREHDPARRGFLVHGLVPQALAFTYYQLSWALYAMRPAWSYRLNADFEDHAEHEYALLVHEHPEWETSPYTGSFADDYGRYATLAELFRQIGYDERLHRLESEHRIATARFR